MGPPGATVIKVEIGCDTLTHALLYLTPDVLSLKSVGILVE